MLGTQQSLQKEPGVFLSVAIQEGPPEHEVGSQEYRRRLRHLLSGEERGPSEKIQAILALGTEWLGAENGHLTRIDPAEGTHRIVEVSGPHPKIRRGATTDLSETYCRKVVAGGDGLAVGRAEEQGWKEDPAYEEFGLSTYLSAKVLVHGHLYGTVCFVDREPREEPFREEEAGALELIVRAISQVLERSRHAERLRDMTVRLKALSEGSPDMIYVHDEAGNLIDPNSRLLEKTGYEEAQLRGMKVWDFDASIGPEEARRRWEEMEVGETRRREGRFQRADGSTFPVEIHLRRLDLEDGAEFLAISRDVTERKERERQLREAKEKAEKAARLKTAMLANMSHELRTPMTSITGFSEMLKERLEGREREFADRIHQSGRRLSRTLDSVLHLSRLEAGSYDLKREPVRLDQLVQQTVRLLEMEAEEKSIELETKTGPARGHWNEAAIQHIAENLVENAVKFTPEGGRVELRVREEKEEAVLEVEDTGIGMDPGRVQEMFEPFVQESEGVGREYEGTGLGLSIVDRFVEAHGGTIEVDTEEDEGTCVAVRLPKATGETPPS